MSPTVGYARVSSFGQDLEVQLEKLNQASCAKIFREKRSGVELAVHSCAKPLNTCARATFVMVLCAAATGSNVVTRPMRINRND